MKKPIIGITGNQRDIPNDQFIHISYTSTGFIEGVNKVGGIPIILPIGDEALAHTYITMIDKLILTGGQNVHPHFYGEEQTIESDDYLLQRDLFELALIREARKQNKPIFGVCRGTQLYNVAMGGTLHQDIENHWQDSTAQYTTQTMVTKNGSILHELYGSTCQINSFHHQSIKDLATNLEVIAYDPRDKVIEAVTSTDGSPFLGVQWHPEYLFPTRSGDLALFDYVVHKL